MDDQQYRISFQCHIPQFDSRTRMLVMPSIIEETSLEGAINKECLGKIEL